METSLVSIVMSPVSPITSSLTGLAVSSVCVLFGCETGVFTGLISGAGDVGISIPFFPYISLTTPSNDPPDSFVVDPVDRYDSRAVSLIMSMIP